MAAHSKRTIWAARILTALAALPFAGGIMKVMQHPAAVEGFAKSNIPQAAILPLGIVELACMVLYLIPRTAVLGAVLLTGYLGGAVLANLINRSDLIHAVVIGVLVWAGAWLRVPELRKLFPLRSE